MVARLRATVARARGASWWWTVPVLVPVVVFVEGVTGRRVVAPGDGHTYYLPLHELVTQHWRTGSFPSWDRGTFGGSPLFSLHQAGALHPAALVRLVTSAVVGHNLTLVLALAVAGSGAYALAHRLAADRVAAAVSGCAFALCGFQFAHLGHVAIVATTAWLPWLIWAADRLEERSTLGRGAAAAGVVAMAALSGHGQMLVVVLGGGFAYAVLASARPVRAAVRVLAATAVGLALAAVQLLPVIGALGESDRAALTYEEATAYAQGAGGLLLLIAPFLYGNARREGPVTTEYAGDWSLTELSGYVGAAALVLAVAGLPALRRDRRLRALVILGVGAVVASLGTGPTASLIHDLPVVGQMRSWARYTVGAQLAVAVAAGVGVARARSGASAVSGRTLAIGAVGAAVGLALLPSIADQRVEGVELAWAVGMPLAAALAAAGGLVVLRRRPRLAPLLVVVVVVDLVFGFGWSFRWRTASPTPDEAAALVAGDSPPPWGKVPDAPGGVDRYLWDGDPLDARPWTPRVASANGVLSVTGMDPLAPADQLEATGTDYWGRITDRSRLLGPESHLLDLLRVTAIVRSEGAEAPPVVRTRRPRLPEAFLVGAVRETSFASAVDGAVGRTPLEPDRTALVDTSCPGCSGLDSQGPAGTVGPASWGTSSVAVDVDADRDALLVISQSWTEGWSATVDGEDADVVRVDGVVQGVVVPPGRSHVVLRYEVPGLRSGAVVSGATAALVLAALVVDRRRRHRQPGSHRRASMADGEISQPTQIG